MRRPHPRGTRLTLSVGLAVASFVALSLAWPAPARAGAAVGAAGELPRGELIESVRLADDPRQSYALYLPKAYAPDKKWPVLYAFDPLARGRVPVGLFRAAAERYGYVVVGSHDSRNGMDPAAVGRIIIALWKDTHARLSLDDRRVYAAGFSGGARVSHRFATACGGCVAGVISAGAGFPPELAPKSPPPYSIFATIGIDDYNFRELRPLARELDRLGAASRLETFDGPHRWPPPEIADAAIEWMELQGMRWGRRAKDDALIDAALARLAARADAERDPYEKYIAARLVVTTFAGLRDVRRFEEMAAALRASKELAASVAAEDREIAREQEQARGLVALGAGLLEDATREETLARVRRTLAPLREKARAKEDTPDRRVARRTLAHVHAETFESALYLYAPRKEYRAAAANLTLATEINPTNPNSEYELARVLALDGRRSLALDALGRAAEKGFGDAARIEAEAAFAPLRAEKRYGQALEKVRSAAAPASPPPPRPERE